MALELDTRQRAMLQEMGVHVWLPESGVAVLERAPSAVAVTARAPVTAPIAATGTTPLAAPVVAPTAAAHSPQHAPTVPASTLAKAPQVRPVAAAHAGEDAASPDWQTLTENVRPCKACALCAGRSHTTLVAPADGLSRCDWMVLGDPPDEDEDQSGAAFAGPDGMLLSNMLRALGLQRANPLPGAAGSVATSSQALAPERLAYVTNVLKCRPSRGAMPQAAELAQCSAWLQREIALVQPKVILSMGRFANQVLLGETPELAALPLGKLRGTVHRYLGLPVVVSYPPKQLMRNSADKAKAWADLCLAAATADHPGH
ncbi:uracil-DNA glycosylase [Rhodoferax lacus]|uniref:Uracil-DNA glycosylase n=1 Tax=Rhodoferax lacus TaxID=2184758 RepID=A0A3E1RAI7_9BURK|nr:uracil-DNA glycosylase [Rhodoferax lacus]RFO96283.1 uracil-DNA glycosylase [Rhodoferax lacus]